MSKKRVLELIEMPTRELSIWFDRVPTDLVQKLLKNALVEVENQTKSECMNKILMLSALTGEGIEIRLEAARICLNYTDPSIEVLKQ